MKEKENSKSGGRISRRQILRNSGVGLALSAGVSKTAFAESSVRDSSDRRIKWTFNSNTSHITGLSKQRGSLYLGVENHVVEIDTKTGKKSQSTRVDRAHVKTAPSATPKGLITLSARKVTLLDNTTLSKKWSVKTSQPPVSAELIGDIVCVLLDRDRKEGHPSRVLALSISSGDTVWERKLEGGASGMSKLEGSGIVVGQSQGKLTKLSPRGEQVWEVTTQESLNTQPAVTKSHVYIRDTGRVHRDVAPRSYRVNRATGDLKQVRKAHQQVRNTQYQVSGLGLIAPTKSGIEIDSKTDLSGKTLTEMGDPVENIGESPKEIIAISDGDMHLIEKPSGNLRSKVELPKRMVIYNGSGIDYQGSAGSMSVTGNRVYVSTQAGVVVAVDLGGDK